MLLDDPGLGILLFRCKRSENGLVTFSEIGVSGYLCPQLVTWEG